ncbi:MAG: hypothetical protein KME57_35525 [Scytonema hyalinum WJT4-NPBG1]|jgi:hypothetical protein|nr:hypothetical protein [Scytonema hyalinum WJT4-NPBG1]
MTLCVPRFTFFPLLPLLIEPIRIDYVELVARMELLYTQSPANLSSSALAGVYLSEMPF